MSIKLLSFKEWLKIDIVRKLTKMSALQYQCLREGNKVLIMLNKRRFDIVFFLFFFISNEYFTVIEC